MAALFSDPFMEPQFSNRQSKTLSYQVQTDTQTDSVHECSAQVIFLVSVVSTETFNLGIRKKTGLFFFLL